MKVGFARGFGIDAHRATLQGFALPHPTLTPPSPHPHLAVHEHGEKPVAEGVGGAKWKVISDQGRGGCST